MANIPLFRVIVFVLITLLALAVLGICAHIQFLISGSTDAHASFAPFGIGVACLTAISLPLFLALGNLRNGVFSCTILFEIVWFFLLWVLWAASAGDTVAGKLNRFPDGCIHDDHTEANRICYEIMVVEAFAFGNFFCAIIYYNVLFLYAIVNAIRGRGIWITSVKEAATGVPMVQPQFNVALGVQFQSYSVPPAQPGPYSPYPQTVLPQSSPAEPYPPPFPPQSPPPRAYPRQALPQSPLSEPYDARPQQAPPQGDPNQPHNYPPFPRSPRQQVN